jgi:hypothetical protein
VTKDEIVALYDEMDTLTVGLTLAPELGPEYLKEKITECRQKQNRAINIFLSLSRETSTLRLRLQAARQAVKIAGASAQAEEFRRQIPDLVDEHDSARYALEALKVVRSNLNRTQTEIRTLADIITGRSGEKAALGDHIPDTPGANTGLTSVSREVSIAGAMRPDRSDEGGDEDEAAIEAVFEGLPEPEVVQPLSVAAEVKPLTVGSRAQSGPVPQDEVTDFFAGASTTPPPAQQKDDAVDIDSLL